MWFWSVGVATYQALLASERDDDVPTPNIQLCEGLVAVYMSLLLHAMANNNANELYRLVSHDLTAKTWASVFGGGAKVVAKNKLSGMFHVLWFIALLIHLSFTEAKLHYNFR